MRIENAKVLTHERLGPDYRLLVLECAEIADKARPGQFVHLRIPPLDSFVLRRPFSIFNVEQRNLSILYKLVGKGTRAMVSILPGVHVNIIGPLGNGFPMDHAETYPVLVAGGYGIAALYILAKELPEAGTVFIGGGTATQILCAEEFSTLSWDVRIATEDGSQGERGMVTDVLDRWLRNEKPAKSLEFYAGGPDGMLQAVGQRAAAKGMKAWLSLDRHMGCGIGACLACVQRVRTDNGNVRWARVCRDGPVFEYGEMVW